MRYRMCDGSAGRTPALEVWMGSDQCPDSSHRARQTFQSNPMTARRLLERVQGRELDGVRRRLDAIHAEVRASRLFVATHMHAGDGNVHTNIRVFSNDYEMLREADGIVDRVMELARSLGGVISGEHGIGITKMAYVGVGSDVLDAFARYHGVFAPNSAER
jgi:FAD/FMN-containing dehydrogenase